MTTVTLAQALDVAVQHHQQGDLRTAMPIYAQILAAAPDQVDALHLLGLAHYQTGDPASAVELIQRALRLNPDFAVAHNNLGLALWEMQRLPEAIAAFQRAMALQPDYIDAMANLGSVLLQADQPDQALAVLQQARQRAPTAATVHHNLGSVYRKQGDFALAEAAFQTAVELDPQLAQAWVGLAQAQREQNAWDKALTTLQTATVCLPNDVAIAVELGHTLHHARQPAAARRQFERALQRDAQHGDAHFGMGCLDQEAGAYEQAEQHYQAALAAGSHLGAQLNLANLYHVWNRGAAAVAVYQQLLREYPHSAEAANNYGNFEKDQGRSSAAIALYRHALALQPDFAEALKNLGATLRDGGDVAEGLRVMEQALALRPDDAVLRQGWLFSLNYADHWSAAAVYQAHVDFGRRYPVAPLPVVWPAAHQPLNVGYVSGDFRGHSVAYFIEQILQGHDRRRVQPYAYFTVARGDAVTERLRQACPQWRDVAALDDAALAQMIRDDGIDILVDLAGHTAHNRLSLFARRPAPLQLTWLGYPNTTGLSAIDYRLTDAAADPPGFEALSSERLWRLPNSYFCYRPDPQAPAVAALPAGQNGYITLGSCNTRAKLSPTLLQLWAEALQALPTAKLLLKAKTLLDPQVQQDLRDFFEARGIAAHRLDIRGYAVDPQDHLATYHQIDLALDSYPYNGATTTCEALWMGVPVITWAGDRPPARMGASILQAAGLPHLIASSREQYLAQIIDWASHLPRLAALRAELRQRLQASPLLDAAGFTQDLETAYQTLWKARHDTQ